VAAAGPVRVRTKAKPIAECRLRGSLIREIEKRVRCDEGRPHCKRCVRLNLECAYGLKLLWEDEAIRRGIALGRSGKSVAALPMGRDALRQSSR
jgi:hypothetical protein